MSKRKTPSPPLSPGGDESVDPSETLRKRLRAAFAPAAAGSGGMGIAASRRLAFAPGESNVEVGDRHELPVIRRGADGSAELLEPRDDGAVWRGRRDADGVETWENETVKDEAAFDALWRESMAERRRQLDANPRVQFVTLLAGSVATEVEDMYEPESVRNQRVYDLELREWMKKERDTRMVPAKEKLAQVREAQRERNEVATKLRDVDAVGKQLEWIVGIGRDLVSMTGFDADVPRGLGLLLYLVQQWRLVGFDLLDDSAAANRSSLRVNARRAFLERDRQLFNNMPCEPFLQQLDTMLQNNATPVSEIARFLSFYIYFRDEIAAPFTHFPQVDDAWQGTRRTQNDWSTTALTLNTLRLATVAWNIEPVFDPAAPVANNIQRNNGTTTFSANEISALEKTFERETLIGNPRDSSDAARLQWGSAVDLITEWNTVMMTKWNSSDNDLSMRNMFNADALYNWIVAAQPVNAPSIFERFIYSALDHNVVNALNARVTLLDDDDWDISPGLLLLAIVLDRRGNITLVDKPTWDVNLETWTLTCEILDAFYDTLENLDLPPQPRLSRTIRLEVKVAMIDRDLANGICFEWRKILVLQYRNPRVVFDVTNWMQSVLLTNGGPLNECFTRFYTTLHGMVQTQTHQRVDVVTTYGRAVPASGATEYYTVNANYTTGVFPTLAVVQALVGRFVLFVREVLTKYKLLVPDAAFYTTLNAQMTILRPLPASQSPTIQGRLFWYVVHLAWDTTPQERQLQGNTWAELLVTLSAYERQHHAALDGGLTHYAEMSTFLDTWIRDYWQFSNTEALRWVVAAMALNQFYQRPWATDLQARIAALDAVITRAQGEHDRLVSGERDVLSEQQRIARELYVPPRSWQTQPEISGRLRLRPEIVAALDDALTQVQAHVPALAHCKMDDLALAPMESGLPGAFARMVSVVMLARKVHFPQQYVTAEQHRAIPAARIRAMTEMKRYAVTRNGDAVLRFDIHGNFERRFPALRAGGPAPYV